jgi:hypothetical protein
MYILNKKKIISYIFKQNIHTGFKNKEKNKIPLFNPPRRKMDIKSLRNMNYQEVKMSQLKNYIIKSQDRFNIYKQFISFQEYQLKRINYLFEHDLMVGPEMLDEYKKYEDIFLYETNLDIILKLTLNIDFNFLYFTPIELKKLFIYLNHFKIILKQKNKNTLDFLDNISIKKEVKSIFKNIYLFLNNHSNFNFNSLENIIVIINKFSNLFNKYVKKLYKNLGLVTFSNTKKYPLKNKCKKKFILIYNGVNSNFNLNNKIQKYKKIKNKVHLNNTNICFFDNYYMDGYEENHIKYIKKKINTILSTPILTFVELEINKEFKSGVSNPDYEVSKISSQFSMFDEKEDLSEESEISSQSLILSENELENEYSSDEESEISSQSLILSENELENEYSSDEESEISSQSLILSEKEFKKEIFSFEPESSSEDSDISSQSLILSEKESFSFEHKSSSEESEISSQSLIISEKEFEKDSSDEESEISSQSLILSEKELEKYSSDEESEISSQSSMFFFKDSLAEFSENESEISFNSVIFDKKESENDYSDVDEDLYSELENEYDFKIELKYFKEVSELENVIFFKNTQEYFLDETETEGFEIVDIVSINGLEYCKKKNFCEEVVNRNMFLNKYINETMQIILFKEMQSLIFFLLDLKKKITFESFLNVFNQKNLFVYMLDCLCKYVFSNRYIAYRDKLFEMINNLLSINFFKFYNLYANIYFFTFQKNYLNKNRIIKFKKLLLPLVYTLNNTIQFKNTFSEGVQNLFNSFNFFETKNLKFLSNFVLNFDAYLQCNLINEKIKFKVDKINENYNLTLATKRTRQNSFFDWYDKVKKKIIPYNLLSIIKKDWFMRKYFKENNLELTHDNINNFFLEFTGKKFKSKKNVKSI